MQGHLTGVAQGHRHQVVDVDIVHLLGRPVLGRDDDLPAFAHFRHAPFRRRRRFEQQVTGHQVHVFLGKLARRAPVRHPGRRTVGDEALQVVVAVLARDVGRQRLAGGALAQNAVAAGAALEVELRGLLEFLGGHDRVIGLAAGNLDLQLTERGHRRFIRGGGAVGVFLGLFLGKRGARDQGKRQRGAAQQHPPGAVGSGCHLCSPSAGEASATLRQAGDGLLDFR